MKRRTTKWLLLAGGCALLLLPLLLAGCDQKSTAETQIRKELGEGRVRAVNVFKAYEVKMSGHVSQETPDGPVVIAEIELEVEIILANGEKQRRSYTLKVKGTQCTNYEINTSDPWVVQVPDDWYDMSGSFRSSGRSGDLDVVEEPVLADPDGTYYAAESGFKTVLVKLPDGHVLDAGESLYTYDLRFHFDNATSNAIVKVIYAAEVRTEHSLTGETAHYFPPIYPAETDFAAVSETLAGFSLDLTTDNHAYRVECIPSTGMTEPQFIKLYAGELASLVFMVFDPVPLDLILAEDREGTIPAFGTSPFTISQGHAEKIMFLASTPGVYYLTEQDVPFGEGLVSAIVYVF